MNTIVRFDSSAAINITETVAETVKMMKGAFHVENVADAIEFQGVKVVEVSSVKRDLAMVGKNQIRDRLNMLSRYGWIMRLGSGWFSWN